MLQANKSRNEIADIFSHRLRRLAREYMENIWNLSPYSFFSHCNSDRSGSEKVLIDPAKHQIKFLFASSNLPTSAAHESHLVKSEKSRPQKQCES